MKQFCTVPLLMVPAPRLPYFPAKQAWMVEPVDFGKPEVKEVCVMLVASCRQGITTQKKLLRAATELAEHKHTHAHSGTSVQSV